VVIDSSIYLFLACKLSEVIDP